eukprot:2100806-Pyramimonas_sp.AAC.3
MDHQMSGRRVLHGSVWWGMCGPKTSMRAKELLDPCTCLSLLTPTKALHRCELLRGARLRPEENAYSLFRLFLLDNLPPDCTKHPRA